MIIGTCGFSWSGSSAVSDLLSEYEENQVYNQIEFTIAFFPDGLDDLYYQVQEHKAKFISSTVAIPRFRKMALKLLMEPTNGKITSIVDRYIDDIVQVQWRGRGQGQEALHCTIYNVFSDYYTRILRRFPNLFVKSKRYFPFVDMKMAIDCDEFVERSQRFIDDILISIGLNLNKNIVLDQPFSGNNPEISMKFFKNSKAIIVDRDPRDIYILSKMYYPTRTNAIPHDNVQSFIDYYRLLHKHMNDNSDEILSVRFEDLIYEYDKTVDRIEVFTGIRNHNKPQVRFVPRESMINTQLFKNTDLYQDDIRMIEKQLRNYLFDFKKYEYCPIRKKVFDEKPALKIQK